MGAIVITDTNGKCSSSGTRNRAKGLFSALRFTHLRSPPLRASLLRTTGEFGDILASKPGYRPPPAHSANFCKLEVQTEGGHSRK